MWERLQIQGVSVVSSKRPDIIAVDLAKHATSIIFAEMAWYKRILAKSVMMETRFLEMDVILDVRPLKQVGNVSLQARPARRFAETAES
jgi:hypothetical protein